MVSLVLGGIAALFALLQTTWFAGWTLAGARPDVVLIVLTVSAHHTGVQRGQISGFLVGVVEDILSIAPLGFHAVLRLVHAAVVGLSSGAVQADTLLTPMLLVGLATIIKQITAAVFSQLIGAEEIVSAVFSMPTAVELGLNVLIAPLGFWLLKPVIRRFSRTGGFS
ncbi:MAG: rod shape-determining protein MreD [Alkalispirochaeta sp.]